VPRSSCRSASPPLRLEGQERHRAGVQRKRDQNEEKHPPDAVLWLPHGILAAWAVAIAAATSSSRRKRSALRASAARVDAKNQTTAERGQPTSRQPKMPSASASAGAADQGEDVETC
jgi:hypothetical protein